MIAEGYWQLSGASVRGHTHQQYDIPCQDRHGYRLLAQRWALAVVADGAGSKSHSDIGAKLIVDATLDYLQATIEQDWSVDAVSQLADVSYFRALANRLYHHLYCCLQAYAEQHDMAIETLGSTLIATILSPTGAALIHIGDGRAAYQDAAGQWHALMTPWRGEEGDTVFVTTKTLQAADVDLAHYVRISYVDQPVQAVVLMSDGCESSAFECQVFDESLQRYVRPNRPFANFLNPVKTTLAKLHDYYGADQVAIDTRFGQFLQDGTDSLKHQGDDKTFIFAVYQTPVTPLLEPTISDD